MISTLTGVVGEREQAQERCSVEGVQDLNHFYRPSVPRGRELFSGAVLGVKSAEAPRSCPGGTASGYSFTGAPGTSWARRWPAGLLPEGQISRRDKAGSKQKDRQIGRCCGGQTRRVVLDS